MKNLIARTLSGILFLAVMIGAIIYGGYVFFSLSCVIVGIGTFEFIKMTVSKATIAQKILSIIMSVVFVFGCWSITTFYFYAPVSSFAIVGLSITAIFIIELYNKSETPLQNISSLVLPVLYIAVPFVLMNLFSYQDGDSYSSGKFILAFFILIWSNDVGAYCFGCTLGRHGKHKLFERISPKKSWEGFIGGIITAIIAGVLCAIFLIEQPIWHWVVIAIIASVFGTLGDLIESMLKRSAGVKDSGNILPGHGGILDRFDAAIFAFPPVFIYQIITSTLH